MSTLIRNIGILDARKASPEQVREIGKIANIGCLVVSRENKGDFIKVSMENVGKTVELGEEFKLHTGPLEITRQMLEDSGNGVNLCVVGPLSVDADIPAKLLQEKLTGLHLIGPASVPENLYGAFMSKVKDITGPVASLPVSGVRTRGNVTITNDYLKGLEDASEISVSGNVSMEEEFDQELFLQKIKSLRVGGMVKCCQCNEELMNKVLIKTDRTRVKISRYDYHYVPGGTVIDTFTLMKIDKQTVSCYGLLILDKDLTPELINKRNISFEAGTVYFPKAVMEAMVSRLSTDTRGLPYEPGTLEVVTGEQCMTSARLATMTDNSILVVIGELEIDTAVTIQEIYTKIGYLDNYGEIRASKDITSILQSKLRRDEGSIVIQSEEEEGEKEDCLMYDNVIENVATYSL